MTWLCLIRPLRFGLPVTVLLVAGCVPAASPSASGGAPASASPTTPGSDVPGLTWTAAPDVERPPDMSADEPSVPPVVGGGLGHPGHFPGQGYLVDVTDGRAGLVAAGYAFPGWHATAWTSDAGQRWRRHVADGGDDTFLLAIAAGPDGYVAVGRAGNEAAAWASPNGTTWRRVDGPPPETALETRMMAVAAGPEAFVAGGWAGSPAEPTTPRLWWSADGSRWDRIPLEVVAGEQARVRSVASGPAGWVAVGTIGPEWGPTASVTWTSADGRTWTRSADGEALRRGQMASVTAAGGGFLAVGSDLDERQAVSWTSPDGRTWTASQPQAALDNHGLKIRMTDAIAADGRIVAVGNYLFGTQYGNATSWTSTEGLTWTPAPKAAALNQSEMLAIAAADRAYISVGTFGAPDNYVPTVWLSSRDGGSE